MFEGAVAAFLNRLLGRYVEDLDTEHFNVGIFSGNTCLTDLTLKPEALYQLGLPIKVQVGLIGKITLKIPWMNLFAQPVVLNVEDVFIVAVPESHGPYDADIQKRLIRAMKKKILDDLDNDNHFISNFLNDILSSSVKNFQISINNVHIRYEENLTGDTFVVGGICLQSLSVATTNNKWKPGVTPPNSTSVYQLMKVESLSLYLNPKAESCFDNYSNEWDQNSLFNWKDIMAQSLQTFAINSHEFQFLIKPFTTKVKIIISKNNSTEISRMLVDIVLQDIAMQISKQQYASMCQLQDSLRRASISRQHRKFRPNINILSGGSKYWWLYAYNSVSEHHIRPYTWKYLSNHRINYNKYKEAYMLALLKPNDTELKLDLQKYEDSLTILNIIIAREHAKIDLEKLHPSQVTVELGESGSAIRLVHSEKSVDPLSEENNIIQKNDDVSMFDGNENDDKYCSPDNTAAVFDRKYNFTLANYSLSLLNNSREILIISITQFLSSIETRTDSSSFKISTRAESFVVEGVSSDNDLVTIVTTDNILTGNVSSNFLAVDYEKKAVTTHCNYDLTATLEPIEITYYNFSVAEVINFFEINEARAPTVTISLYKTYMKVKNEINQLSEKALSRTTRINLKLDMKGPYIVFPEHGTLQKEGHILLLDFGRLTLKTELQPFDVQLEDATIMELEELLYDRLNLVLTDGEVIFCHGGDDWRELRKLKESEFHIVPKLQVSITVACSIRPGYRILPRIKLNVSASHVKFNLSDQKVQFLMMFLDLLTIPSRADIDDMRASFKKYVESHRRSASFSTADLYQIRSIIVWSSIVTSRYSKSQVMIKDFTNCNATEVERSIISSEISEEDLEQWFKSSNFSGFEDFISPSNYIDLLLRFVIGELSFNFASNATDGRHEPYLTLKLSNFYSEVATMKYGFAIQSGLGSILLADKTEVGVIGSYLELISTDNTCEVFTLSHRKIRADCPEFKSQFKNVECSSVVHVGNINVIVHRCALIKLKHFVTNMRKICSTKSVGYIIELIKFGITFCKKKKEDPPVPSGAIKLSYSIRLNSLSLKLCNKDEDLFLMKFGGIENDCIYNANERMILRAHLRSWNVEDLSDSTVYCTILSSEDDKVFDFKYVRHTPKLYKCADIDTQYVDILTDGTFKLSIGRVNYVFLSRTIRDLQRFLVPFVLPFWRKLVVQVKNAIYWSIEAFRKSETKLRLSIDLQGPILLLPQKKNSPTLLIFDIGSLSIENFFKKSELQKQSSKSSFESDKFCNYSYIIDNILIKIKAMTLFRAIITLTGNLERREPIIDGVNVRYDVKRKLMFKTDTENHMHNVLYDVQGSTDLITINIAQKDLTSMFIIWEDNISKLFLINDSLYDYEVNLLTRSRQDTVVKNLEAFLSHDEQPFCEISVKLSFDGLHINLFSDTDEVLSSPVRDLNQGLCKLSLDEATVLLDYFSDKSLNVKMSAKTFNLEDVRKCSYVVRRIIQSPLKNSGENKETQIYVSMPPALDVTFHKNCTGDAYLDILIEESQINFSISFFTELGHYLINSIPHEQIDEGFVNEAYEDTDTTIKNVVKRNIEANYLKHSDVSDEQPGYSMSLRLRNPKLCLLSNIKSSNAHTILIEAELTVEKSRHKESSSVVFTLSGLRAKSNRQDQNYHWILKPCDIEIHRKERIHESDVRVNVNISSIKLYLCVGVINSILNIIGEIVMFFQKNNTNVQSKVNNSTSGFQNDLWCPKEIFRICYKQPNKKDYELKGMAHQTNFRQVKICEIKPTVAEILFILEETLEKVPIIKSKAVIQGTINDWDENFVFQFDIKICAFCYNINRDTWEPLIELCQDKNIVNKYKFWEVSFKVYQAQGFPLTSNLVEYQFYLTRQNLKKKRRQLSCSEDEVNEDMVFIIPKNASSKVNDVNYTFEIEDDSDNTDDEMNSETLNQTFQHLLTADSNDEDRSESEDSSKFEDEDEDRCAKEISVASTNKNNTLKNNVVYSKATYVVVYSKEIINFMISTNTIDIIDKLMNAFANDKKGIPVVPAKVGKLCLQNNIGYTSKICFFKKKEKSTSKDDVILISSQSFPKTSPASMPGTPDSECHTPANNSSKNDCFTDMEPNFTENEEIDNAMCPFQDNDSVLQLYNQITKERLKIFIEGFEDVILYSGHMKSQSYNLITLRPTKDGIKYYIVVEIKTNWLLHKTITVRSPLQIRNDTTRVLELYYKKQTVEKLNLTHVGETLNPFTDVMRMVVLEPEGVYDVPLFIAYHCSIHISPAFSEKHYVSNDGIFWQDVNDSLNTVKDIHCKPKEESPDNSVFSVKAVFYKNSHVSYNTSRIPEYIIKIVPPLVFENKLPFPVHIDIPHINYQMQIESGERIKVYPIQCNTEFQVTIKIFRYLGQQWIGKFALTPTTEKKYIKMVTDKCDTPGIKPFLLCIEVDRTTSLLVNIYTQYWIINKTGLSLSIGESQTNIIYEIPGEELVILTQKENRKRRRSIRLKAQDSDWSASFKLDGIAPMSLILCKDLERRRKYRIFVEMSISRLSQLVTKIITFLPYFYVANRTKRTIRFMEDNEEADLWNDLLPGQGVAFWPYTESMRMKVKWKNSQLVSECFDIMKVGKTVLHMDNGTAVSIEVTGGSSSPYTIVFYKYRHGDAPTRIDNLCTDSILKINQVNLGQTTLIKPLHSILYTWDDPTKKRELMWNVYQGVGKGFPVEFTKDSFGCEKVCMNSLTMLPTKKSQSKDSHHLDRASSVTSEGFCIIDMDIQPEKSNCYSCDKKCTNENNCITIYWVSYMENVQRVVMFTQNENIFYQVKRFVDPEISEKEFFFSFAGIGVSLVRNNDMRGNKELAYVSLNDTAAHWEVFVGQKWKSLTLELNAWLEDKYVRSFEKAQFQNLIDINISKMYMTKPFFGKMRRTYSPGLWLHYRRSATLCSIQGYLHKAQIDNQCYDTVFPVVLHFNNKECYLTAENRKFKHCVEFQCLKQYKSNRVMYKEISIIIDEFYLNLQQDFVTDLLNNFMIERFQLQPSIAAKLTKDLSAYRTNSCYLDAQRDYEEHHNIIKHIYISPVTIHLKLLASADESSAMKNQNSSSDYFNMIRLIFDYACRGIFEKEAEFRLPSYELSNHTFQNQIFFSNIWNLYAGKILQQFNVLILSIAVLGNPYDNTRSSQENLQDTPVLLHKDDMAEKLANDMAYYLGYTIVDSATEVMLFNALDVNLRLSMFKPSIQNENMEQMCKTSALKNTTSIQIEIELAFLGLVVQPLDSTHQEELKYFFKTLGRKMLRLLKDNIFLEYYPNLIIDTFKRAQETGFKFVSRVRLPRAISQYTKIESYSPDRSKGLYLWNCINKNYFSLKDSYWAHAVLGNDGKRIALVSMQQIFLIDKKSSWGAWNVEWSIEMCHLITPPVLTKHKIVLNVNKGHEPTSPDNECYIESKDDSVLEWLCRKIDMVMIINMEKNIHLLKDESENIDTE